MTNAIKEFDKETGLYYCNARMYDPKIARFLQEDTYTGNPNDPLSLNLYTYCYNEPIMYTDPTGHWRDDAEKEYASRKWDTDDFQRVEALSNLWKKLNNDLKGYKEGTSRYAEIKALRDSYNDESNKIRSKYVIGPSIPTKETGKIQPTSVKNNDMGCTISEKKSIDTLIPEFLYDPAKDSGLSISRQNNLADLTIEWYNATEDRVKSAIARSIDLERLAANDDAIKEGIKGHVEYAINSLVGGGLGTAPILNEMGMSEEALAQKTDEIVMQEVNYILLIVKASGGRLGNQATRLQNQQIAELLKANGYKITGGGGEKAEEYLKGLDGGRKGSNYVDITAKKNGTTIRINTVDTYKSGEPTIREAKAAKSIESKTGTEVIKIPKGSGVGKLPEIIK